MNEQLKNLFSIDLEDWFHLLDTDTAPSMGAWHKMESRVERNTDVLLDLLRETNTKCTFFVLGWVAEKNPDLISKIYNEGHEIASHGYAHKLVYEQSPEEFRNDIKLSKEILEGITGSRPKGYRAPGFSIKKDNLWALDILLEEGFEYDSSIFPASRAHGGLSGADPFPSKLHNGLVEYPISTINMMFNRLAFLGGGYLRLIPEKMILLCSDYKVRNRVPLVLYVHPRDIDVDQPRIKLSKSREFRSYVGLNSTLDKMRSLLEKYSWIPFIEHRNKYF